MPVMFSPPLFFLFLLLSIGDPLVSLRADDYDRISGLLGNLFTYLQLAAFIFCSSKNAASESVSSLSSRISQRVFLIKFGRSSFFYLKNLIFLTMAFLAVVSSSSIIIVFLQSSGYFSSISFFKLELKSLIFYYRITFSLGES